MNLRDLIDIQAGGPGSGCNPLKGRCGRFKGPEKKMLKEKGHLISLKKKGDKYTGTLETKRNVVSKVKVTQAVYPEESLGKVNKAFGQHMVAPMKQQYVTYNYSVVKGKNVSGMSKEFNDVPFKGAPPDKPHQFKGKFFEALRIPYEANPDPSKPQTMADAEKRTSIVYDGGQMSEGQGVTLFVHKYRTGPTSGRVVLEEFDRHDNEIVGKHQIEFHSGKSARDFMRYRYGINVIWSKK